MSSGRSFVFNKNSDWNLSSFSSSAKIDEDCLFLLANVEESAVFISQCLDSGVNSSSWGEFFIKVSSHSDPALTFRAFASDSDEILGSYSHQIEKMSLDKFFSSGLDSNVKLEIFHKMKSLEFDGVYNGPLFELKGRYLWFCIEYKGVSKSPMKIEELEISFPYDNLAEYLPEAYQNIQYGSFMSRFLFIFQRMYQNVENIIDNIPKNFEPEHSNENFILWISQWFNIDISIWKYCNLKLLISKIIKIFRLKGTKKSILSLLKIYTGFKPILIEKINIVDNDFYSQEYDLIDELFGENNYFVTIIMTYRQIKCNFDYMNVLRIINKFLPIDSICNLVVLENNISLGCHCYLGLNSCVSNSYVSNIYNSNATIVID